ncbi:hypothetical protein HDU76_000287 [Blyttiomyces sp. JEL0837]|nr:hypothetical protein HDU76_000287 [Blyttiomyces sp. JEL0837]
MSSTLLLTIVTFITLITTQQVSATFYVPGLPPIRNYDMPGIRTDVNPYQFNHTMSLAVFKDPTSFGPCQLDLTGKSTPGGILFINTEDAYKHGCLGYQALPDANGWFTPCAVGDIACKTSTYDIAIFVLLQPNDFCCTDMFYFRINALYSFANGRFQDSRTLLTGVSTTDAFAIAALVQQNPLAFFENVFIDSVGATDKGTMFFYSNGVKAFLMIRLLVIFVAIAFEASTLVRLLRKERFAFNLKWGVLVSLLLWSFCLLAEYSYFVYYEFFVGWPFSQFYTNLQPSTHQVGFMLAFITFSMMLLTWSKIIKSISFSNSKIINFGKKYFDYVIYLLMFVSVTQCAFFVGAIAASSFDWTDFMLKATPLILAIILIVQAVAYTFYAYFILLFTRVSRPAVSAPSNKFSSNGASNTNTTSSNVADRRRKELTFKMTLLAGVVLIGWLSLAINQLLLKYYTGYQSEFGFWVNTLWQDITFWFVIAVTYVALNLRLESNAFSSGNKSGSNSNNLSGVDHSGASGNGYGSHNHHYNNQGVDGDRKYHGGNNLYPPPVASYSSKHAGANFETADQTTVSHHSQANLTRGTSEEYMYNEYPPYNANNMNTTRARSDTQTSSASYVIPAPALVTNETTLAYPHPYAQPKSAGSSAGRREGPLVIAMEGGVVRSVSAGPNVW